jgi:hypothetical protein
MYKLICAILAMTIISCNSQAQKKNQSDIGQWKVGTSTGIIADFSAESLAAVKAADIDCLELAPGLFTNKTDH